MTNARVFWESFLDGFTGAGIFGDLEIPGLPKTMFAQEPNDAAAEADETDLVPEND